MFYNYEFKRRVMGQNLSTPAPISERYPQSGHPKAPPVWVLAALISSSVTGLTLILPALPDIKASYGLSATQTQLLLSFYLLAVTLGQLLFGVISDAVGRRPVMLAGVCCFFFASIALFFAQSGFELILLRGIQGLGAAASIAMGRAIINDCHDRNGAARITSTVTASMAIIPILALSAGGLVIENSGHIGSFVMMVMLGTLNLIVALTTIKETHSQHGQGLAVKQLFLAYRETLQLRLFRDFGLITSMQAGVFFALQGFLPFKFASLGLSALDFGIWFSFTSLGYLVGNLFSRRYTLRFGLEKMVFYGVIIATISMSLLGLCDLMDIRDPLYYALCLLVFGLGNGVVIANALTGAISASKRRGTATGLVGAGQVASGAVLGWIIAVLGGISFFWVAMVCVHVFLVISFWPAYRLVSAEKTT